MAHPRAEGGVSLSAGTGVARGAHSWESASARPAHWRPTASTGREPGCKKTAVSSALFSADRFVRAKCSGFRSRSRLVCWLVPRGGAGLRWGAGCFSERPLSALRTHRCPHTFHRPTGRPSMMFRKGRKALKVPTTLRFYFYDFVMLRR